MRKLLLCAGALLTVAVVAFFFGRMSPPVPELEAQILENGAGKFKVEIEGVAPFSAFAITGFDAECEVIEEIEVDPTTRTEVIRKRPGRTKYANITLKRGVAETGELYEWYRQVVQGNVERKTGSIILQGDDGSELGRYNFYEGWPCKWYVPDLDSSGASVAIEKIEIAVEKVERAK